MGRQQNGSETTHFASLALLLVVVISCALVYTILSVCLKPGSGSSGSDFQSLAVVREHGVVGLVGDSVRENGGCCRGIENSELWGAAVKWGSEFKLNSSEECCKACKAMCTGNGGSCLCDTWVFCGNRKACGSKFGECWLKKQTDSLAPDRQAAGQTVRWTSGLIFGKGEGIVGLQTKYGTLRIKLFPDCAPQSVSYILELLAQYHCAGCQFYRAESRGKSWDVEGNHINTATFGPPFALIQGTLEVLGNTFNKIPTEVCPAVRRGSVAWVGSGPEFFISLANHPEWKKTYTVFGSVFPEDMGIAERIAQLPTKPDVWNNIDVAVLEKPVPLVFQRIKTSQGDLDTELKSD